MLSCRPMIDDQGAKPPTVLTLQYYGKTMVGRESEYLEADKKPHERHLKQELSSLQDVTVQLLKCPIASDCKNIVLNQITQHMGTSMIQCVTLHMSTLIIHCVK